MGEQKFLTEAQLRDSRFAMRLSLFFGLVMLASKTSAYLMTGSAAIFSDAAESVVHLVAVAFATFSLWLSVKPVDRQFTFGYERICFFSAGVEGALIIVAAITIIYTSIHKWIAGLEIENLGTGSLLVIGAGLVNAGLGWYLVRVGRRTGSIILEANGKHVLTDSWTSLGVVGGLCLVLLTGWKPFDPLFAIMVSINIIWSGGVLVKRSVGGLLDYADPATGTMIRRELDRLTKELNIRYHGVRYRNMGHSLSIEVHLLFPFEMSVGSAHQLATRLEERFKASLNQPAEITTHLEALEDHSDIHETEHYTGLPSRNHSSGEPGTQ